LEGVLLLLRFLGESLGKLGKNEVGENEIKILLIFKLSFLESTVK
jgi:hypothetical protein